MKNCHLPLWEVAVFFAILQEIGLKCVEFYSKVSDTTLDVWTALRQSIFVKLDEGKKFYGEDKREITIYEEIYR